MREFRFLPRIELCCIGLCGVLAACLAGAAGAQDVRLDCDGAAQELELDLPVTLVLPDASGVLLTEERGDNVLIRRETSTRVVTWDLPPNGWAFQSAEFEHDDAAWSLQPGIGGKQRARLRLQAVCDNSWDMAGLRLLAHAGAEIARAEDSALAAAQRNQSRAQAVATLGALVLASEASEWQRRWPWLAPQARQARAYAYARMGRPAESRSDLAAAAAGWKAGGDRLRWAIATHRAAQQQRREGDLVGAERQLRQLAVDTVVRADPILIGVVTNDLCLSLRGQLRLAEALRCYHRAVALHDRAGNVAEAALSRANRADAYAQLGRYVEADAEAQAARLQARHSEVVRVQLLAALVAGNVARAQGRLDMAIQTYLEALGFSERLQDPNLRANALRQIGIAYLLLADFTYAQQFLADAAKAYEDGGYWNNAVIALRNLADAQRNAALPEQARATLARALAIVDAGKAGQGAAAEIHLLRAEIALTDNETSVLDLAIAAAQSALGDSPSYLHQQRLAIVLARRALERGALPAAEAGLVRARRAAQAANDVIGLVELDALQAQVLQRRGLRGPAQRQYEAALQRALHVAGLQTYPLHRASYLAQARRSLEQLLTLSRADVADAVAARFAAVAALHQAAGRGERVLATATPQQAAVLAQINERVRRRWGIQSSEELDEAVAAAPDLFARAEQFDPLLRSAGRGADIPALLRAWQRQLGEGERLIVSFVGERRVFLWSLSRDGLVEQVADTAAPLRAAALALQPVLRSRNSQPEAIHAPLAAIRAAAGLDALRSSAGSRHYLLADGPLSDVPPSLLLADTGDDAVAAPLPAVVRIDTLDAPVAHAPCCSDLPLQAFADPRVDSTAGSARSAAGLPRLPGSREEVLTIAARWPSATVQTWLGTAFTRSRTLDALAQPQSIVHFATHGFVSRDEPGLSALLVAADEAEHGLDVVSFHDLLQTPVRARLIVLGACDTANGNAQPGASGASLAHVLRVAGAESVVAPLWSVDDSAGTAFMRAFYAALAQGSAPEQAVASAQRELAQRAATAHPYYWAGFVVFGGNAGR
ncbi:MAG: CHAT domain-containing protein [Rhodanobacteraceae bacterium]|nr:CHAT domain-containing protein [Rhodanobacteraceae bacterium]